VRPNVLKIWGLLRKTGHAQTDSAVISSNLIIKLPLIVYLPLYKRKQDSSVRIVAGIWAGRSEFYFRQGQGIFIFTTAFRPMLELIQPPIQWIPGPLCPGVNRPGREAGHSPTSSAQVKNARGLYRMILNYCRGFRGL